jgi:hypothetical protein
VAYDEINDRWNERLSQWYSPTEWLNYKEAYLFTRDCDISCRYLILLYHSLINLGTGELSPRNTFEMFGCTISLTFSTLMFSIFFSNITSLILELNFDEIQEQQDLDEANDLMNAIELGEIEADDIRMFFKRNIKSHNF